MILGHQNVVLPAVQNTLDHHLVLCQIFEWLQWQVEYALPEVEREYLGGWRCSGEVGRSAFAYVAGYSSNQSAVLQTHSES